ncbi:hypothetical protein LEP1GSC051_0137 [Leptospira sp. P2653]|nr:hypothetical protein LEP1GSC051_0137 [Leptospira sp. P2653]
MFGHLEILEITFPFYSQIVFLDGKLTYLIAINLNLLYISILKIIDEKE